MKKEMFCILISIMFLILFPSVLAQEKLTMTLKIDESRTFTLEGEDHTLLFYGFIYNDGKQRAIFTLDNRGEQSLLEGSSQSFGSVRITFTSYQEESADFLLEFVGKSPEPFYPRGDANGDGHVDMSDAIATLNYLFQGGTNLGCQGAADANGDGILDLTDAITTLNFLFLGGEAPQNPGVPGFLCSNEPKTAKGDIYLGSDLKKNLIDVLAERDLKLDDVQIHQLMEDGMLLL